jgi:CRP-like cAMP-binding protein/Fe-S-cluster-containing hydrogenase component 2
MAKQVVLNPRAELEPHAGDVRLTEEEFLQLSLFAQLKQKPSLYKFPGALILRHYRKGDLIFRQGEPGWTAFYILTSEDVLRLRLRQLESGVSAGERKPLEVETTILQQRVERLKTAPAGDDLRTAATVFLAVARTPRTRKGGLNPLHRLRPRSLTGPARSIDEKTFYIPIDGPMTLNYDSLRAPLQEGELFGEMSCLYRTPRSATVVARRDCYMLEMLRNILDLIQKDPVYKARSDLVYRQRILDLHLRKLSLFSDLNDAEFAEIRDGVELVSFEPGSLVCDEGERSDCLYIVRSGLVKVVKNVSSLIDQNDVADWPSLVGALAEGEAPGASPDAVRQARGKFWKLLPERVRAIVKGTANVTQMNAPDRLEMIAGVNDIIRTNKLLDAMELKGILDSPGIREQLGSVLDERKELVKKKKDLPETAARRVHRQIADAVLAPALKPITTQSGPETILTYCSRGDYFGEMGLMLSQPRSATCIAYGHPNDYGVVELVRVPGKTFWKLMKTSATLRDKVKQEIAVRRKRTLERLLVPSWEDRNQVQFSSTFENLGLIQGQKLMLIDLDRCTRCDECVKACVATHDDGRSRLFLDGDRFGKYLVPTTCRSCLDPVCLTRCPVGSIHRGDNREIQIESWCIGCGMCAESCPYGSIMMHDLGVVPENACDWRYLPAEAVAGDGWRTAGYKDAAWLIGDAPFRLDRATQDDLAARSPARLTGPAPQPGVCFRYEFHLAKEQISGPEFKLEILSQSSTVTVWLNGHEAKPDEEKPKRGRREFTLPTKPPADAARKPPPLCAGTNVLAVRVAADAPPTEVLFQARLDEVRRPDVSKSADDDIAEEITEKLVTQHAVVCDLCSGLPGQRPACVQACPHDAAMRVNARFEFPSG